MLKDKMQDFSKETGYCIMQRIAGCLFMTPNTTFRNNYNSDCVNYHPFLYSEEEEYNKYRLIALTYL